MPTILPPGLHRELDAARHLKQATGYGAVSTLQRWRREGTEPKNLKWKKVSRTVLWWEEEERLAG